MIVFLNEVNRIVWGIPLLLLIIGTGIYISILCGFPQLRLFPEALRAFVRQLSGRCGNRNGSSYRALCTALAATVGTGNLAGVAGAIALGGPGAIFWMWICGFLGMAIKFAEAVLAVVHQKKRANGELYGGPMYMIKDGFPAQWHWLAAVYAFFGVVASLGVGNATQVNAIIGGIQSATEAFGISLPVSMNLVIGIVLAIAVCSGFTKGTRGIGKITESLVPVMSVGYLILVLLVIILRANRLPEVLRCILTGAFSPKAATGGVVGSMLMTLRIGASRGIFTNEAGMGTAAIAHSTSSVENPIHQGLMGIVEVFLDTIVICSLTAFAILCSGICVPYGNDIGIKLTTEAFISVCGNWVTIPLAVTLLCFGVATIFGWGMYGASCAQYLFGEGVWSRFSCIQALVIIVSAAMNTSTIWLLSDIVNGLMAIPNLVALIVLCPKIIPMLSKNKGRRLIRRSDAGGISTYSAQQCRH